MACRPLTLIALSVLLVTGACAVAQQAPTEKKLIEYGWDVPKPAYVREHIGEMEKRPFDGLILRMAVGGRVFVPTKWAEESYAADLDHLANTEWQRFTDNFLVMYAASEVDWFDDAHWEAALHNVSVTVRAAKAGKCKGVCFDAEPYGKNPWNWREQAHADTKSFAEYQAKYRERGAQFVRAIQDEMPDAVIHTFFVFSFLRDLWEIEDLAERQEKLSQKHYALYPAFINGMLDAAGPNITITDGNEGAYYYQDTLSFYSSYHGIRQRALSMLAPENVTTYHAQVQVAQALYVDHLFNTRTTEYLSAHLSPEERAQWFEHNVYYALTTSDRYVWLYSERMNWWTDENLPAGLEKAVISARAKVAERRPLGFNIRPTIEGGQEREKQAVREGLTTRSTDIARLPEGTEPPEIDGDLSDAAWNAAAPLEPFLPYITAKTTDIAQTEAKVTYDEEALYIALRCLEPKVDAIEVVGDKRDDDIWLGDSVDIFLEPAGQAPTYYHFIISPNNVVWDAAVAPEQDLGYAPEWAHAATVGEGEWAVEAAIPWSALGMTIPKPGSICRANFCRQRMPGRQHGTWSQVVGGFVEPESFGTFTFR